MGTLTLDQRAERARRLLDKIDDNSRSWDEWVEVIITDMLTLCHQQMGVDALDMLENASRLYNRALLAEDK